MTEEQTLTRDQSADKLQKIWAGLVENSPEDTDYIRAYGVESYLVEVMTFKMDGIHADHYKWLEKALNDGAVLACVDALARLARIAGGETKSPWRDVAKVE